MTVDELRGWRQVRDADGKLCGRFGPDSFEDMPRWREWLGTLAQFRDVAHGQVDRQVKLARVNEIAQLLGVD